MIILVQAYFTNLMYQKEEGEQLEIAVIVYIIYKHNVVKGHQQTTMLATSRSQTNV